MALVALLVPGAGPATAAAPGGDPLRVTIDAITPSTLPRKGTVSLSGEVTNTSEDTWTDLQAYLVTASEPIRTQQELAAAARSDPAADLGAPGRITTDGLFTEIGDLAPGQSTGYTVTVPRQDLEIGDEPGVYWMGVQVLGAVDGIRDPLADGRARSFMAQMSSGGPHADVAVVLPVRDRVRRSTDGRLIGSQRWQDTFAPDGRLGRLLALGSESARPLTWLVDPAVLEAAASVAHENPPLSTADDGTGPGDEGSTSTSPSPSGIGDPGPSAGPTDSDEPAQEPTEAAVDAAAWLSTFVEQTSGDAVLTLPYGDLDVASVLDSKLEELYEQATTESAEAMREHGVDNASAVVDPVSGFLPAIALRRIATTTPVLLRDEAFPEAERSVRRYDGRAPVVLTDTAAGSGGPRPNSRYAALAFRQRLLSDAALHALSADRDAPLVVSAPPYWNPGRAWDQADFFAGLDQPWLRMVGLSSVVADAPLNPGRPARPHYPRADRQAQVPFANLLASRQLAETGSTFAALLAANDTVDTTLARIGMLASSQAARRSPDQALSRATEITDYVRDLMRRVRVEGPPFVMMSSESGPIQVKLVNDLDEPVVVGVDASSTSGLRFSSPDPVQLGPGQRTAIRLDATAEDIGVHAVQVAATTEDGTPIGSLTQFNVRTSHVGTVVWVVMGLGGAVLLLAIVVRLIRRIRRRKATHGPRMSKTSGPDGGPGAPDPTDPSGPHERPGQEVGA